MESMFNSATDYNSVLFSTTSLVTNMKSVFMSAVSSNQNLDGWVATEVTDLSSMVEGAVNFNKELQGVFSKAPLSLMPVFLALGKILPILVHN